MERATRVALGDVDLAVPKRPTRCLARNRDRGPRRPDIGRRAVTVDIGDPRPVRNTADHVQVLARVGERIAHVRDRIRGTRNPRARWRRWRRRRRWWRWRRRRRWWWWRPA